jgi:hypothetical protein
MKLRCSECGWTCDPPPNHNHHPWEPFNFAGPMASEGLARQVYYLALAFAPAVDPEGLAMTRKEILLAAIRKTIGNGWLPDATSFEPENVLVAYEGRLKEMVFDHAFAKALWGNGKAFEEWNGWDGFQPIEAWKFHIREMVLAENDSEIVAYLGAHG